MTLAAAAATAAALAAANPATVTRERPALSLTASPVRLVLTADEDASITLTNFGVARLVVRPSVTGLAVDARGRPSLMPASRGTRRGAARWLRLSAAELTLAPRRPVVVHVAANVPRRAEPGDHHAAIVFATRPLERRRVAVRLRLAVRVAVRAPGTVFRRLRVTRLRVVRTRVRRVLELHVANDGNVSEELGPRRLAIALLRRGRVVSRLRVGSRELLPRSRGVFAVRYRGRVRGRCVARVEVDGVTRRAFWVRL